MKLINTVLSVVGFGAGVLASGKLGIDFRTRDLPLATQNIKEAADALDLMGYKGLLNRIEKKETSISDLQAQVTRLTKALAPVDSRLSPHLKTRLAPTGRWKKVEFSMGQVKELEKALNDARVAPDGVKLAWGISTGHDGTIYGWVREGDDLPIKYVVTEYANSGVKGAVQTMIEENLKTREIIPIGWTFGSRSFVYASAEFTTEADALKQP